MQLLGNPDIRQAIVAMHYDASIAASWRYYWACRRSVLTFEMRPRTDEFKMSDRHKKVMAV